MLPDDQLCKYYMHNPDLMALQEQRKIIFPFFLINRVEIGNLEK